MTYGDAGTVSCDALLSGEQVVDSSEVLECNITKFDSIINDLILFQELAV